ncbi:MAG: hypothetical protein ABIK44_02765 [candidate division WOR-3 bacterium]
MFRMIPLLWAALATGVFAQAGADSVPQVLVMPYDSTMEDRVTVDGYIDKEDDEYPASFTNKATGITVYWGYDDSLMFIGLESKGKGWLAIGFGSDKMHEANMVIGRFHNDVAEVVNHVGVNRTHAAANLGDSLLIESEIDFDEETGTMAMEFVYPLSWNGLKGAAISGLVPGEVYDLLLARNARTAALTAKHGQKAQLKFQLATNPGEKKSGEQ